jgi:Family of unknown function (DUF6334)
VGARVTATPPTARNPETLTLDFEGVQIVFVARSDDSLAVCDLTDVEAPEAEDDVETVDLTDEDPWRAAVGKPLMWAWSMTNNFGYRDGFQLEFAVDTSDSAVVVQLIVLSSWIHIRPLDEEFLPPISAG